MIIALSINFLRFTDVAILLHCLSRYYTPATFNVKWLVVSGLTAPSDSVSVYIGPSSRKKRKIG